MNNRTQKIKLMIFMLGSICGSTWIGVFTCAFKFTDADIFLLLAGAGAVVTLTLSALFIDVLSSMGSDNGD